MKRIKADRLRPPHKRGLWAFVKRRLRPEKVIPDQHLAIMLNNVCNLKCYSCVALGMGQRPTPGETTLQEIEAFLYHMEKYKPGSTVMITGGEPTMSPNLGRVAREIGARGFKSFLLTNGFKLVEPAWFDYIILDDHGINKSEIENWKRGLRDTDVWWKVRNKTMHIDTLNAKYLNITKGARCSSWLDPLTLWRDVVYPCCLMMCVEWWHYTDEITKALRASGWTVENPSLVSTIKNWRETLPSEFYRFCSLKCWRDSEKVIWVPIGAERV